MRSAPLARSGVATGGGAPAAAKVAGAVGAPADAIVVSIAVLLCAESLSRAVACSAVHAGPPRRCIALSGPKRAVEGGTGVADAGVLATWPAAVSVVAFLSDASSISTHDARSDAPSIVERTQSRVR